MTTADDDGEAFLASLETMSLASLRDEWRRRWGPGAVSLTLKVLHFEGCKPLVEKVFYETAIV